MTARRVVLVVDDEAITRDVVGAMLELEDIEVHTAHDGTSALELAARVHPDLVLLDVMMPDLDGIEVCRLLMEANGRSPRVVMLTAKGDSESKRAALQAGASAYLVKPFSAVDLFRVLDEEAARGS